MTKSAHAVLTDDPKFRGYLSSNAWTLCLGAGISKGIAPDWLDLAHQVINEAYSAKVSFADFDLMVKKSGWTLDSWIQAAANEFHLQSRSPDEFKELIESILYSTIRKAAHGLGLDAVLTQVLNEPKSAPRDLVIKICELFDNTYGNSSLLQTAHFLIKAHSQGKRPKSVLTFNADTLLETYIDIKLRTKHYLGPGPHSHPEYPFVQVIRPNYVAGNKIPIIHCHGSLAPKSPIFKNAHDSRDRLIFLEQEYLSMNHSGAAWGGTEFLHHAHSTKLVFLGMSMSDANIRKWTSSTKIERQTDLMRFGCTDNPNPPHLWLRPFPSETLEQSIFLASLQHLGIRPAWMKSWAYIFPALSHLCALM